MCPRPLIRSTIRNSGLVELPMAILPKEGTTVVDTTRGSSYFDTTFVVERSGPDGVHLRRWDGWELYVHSHQTMYRGLMVPIEPAKWIRPGMRYRHGVGFGEILAVDGPEVTLTGGATVHIVWASYELKWVPSPGYRTRFDLGSAIIRPSPNGPDYVRYYSVLCAPSELDYSMERSVYELNFLTLEEARPGRPGVEVGTVLNFDGWLNKLRPTHENYRVIKVEPSLGVIEVQGLTTGEVYSHIGWELPDCQIVSDARRDTKYDMELSLG